MSDDEPEVQMRPPLQSMFGAPLWSPEEQYDVVFVGVPSDAGSLGWRSPALAPLLLRAQSQLFPQVSNAKGECVGWYDYHADVTRLRGVKMADAGDFVFDRRLGSRQLDSLPSVYATLRDSARLLVVIGGDHSISYWLAQALRGEALIWMDAHADASPVQGERPHCANVVSYIDPMPNVPAILQFGLRGLVPNAIRQPPSHRVHCRDVKRVVAEIQERGMTAAAVTLDVDVLDPSIMPAVASAMPGGLQMDDVLSVFDAVIAAGVRIPILEIAEFSPVAESDDIAALSLVNFLLRAIDRCLTI